MPTDFFIRLYLNLFSQKPVAPHNNRSIGGTKMDDFAFPDEETIIKMKREYDKALRTAKSVSTLSTARRTAPATRCYF